MCAKIAETPMMSQYNAIKQQHPDAILLFRVGDFYETFSTDAIEVSGLLGITLTKRANGSASHVELAGFPHHALDTYLPKLVALGKRVAICDQMENPKLTKKLVKRQVTELVTPGLTMNDTVLVANTNNFLAAVTLGAGKAGVAFLDLSTGEFLTSQGYVDDIDKLIHNFNPKEVLIKRGTEHEITRCFGDKLNIYPLEDWVFTEDYGRDRLMKHFELHHLKGLGIESNVLSIIACGTILYYLQATCHEELGHITSLRKIEEDHFVRLDKFTLRNLEILNPITDEGVSLINIMDATRTPMGGRLLKRWVVFPLLDPAEIARRQSAVQALLDMPEQASQLDDYLSGIGDIERLTSKVAVSRINPREMLQMATALRLMRPIKDMLHTSTVSALKDIAITLDPCDELARKIEDYINPDAPIALGRGAVIRDGVNAELDALREISGGGKDYLMQIRAREAERTGIPNLKIAFNNVFGYFIEVRNTHKDKVPEDWIRKQTLVNAERYITQELKEYEQKILGAEEKIQALEAEIFAGLMNTLGGYMRVLQSNALAISTIDVLNSFAKIAKRNDYHCPVVDNSEIIDIKEGRHPVIERLLPAGEMYVPNDVYLDTDGTQIIVITGPNMSGKSALLRQTALITLMAQIGSFVPAKSARIGIVDRIFTRVGASDNISRGESTFMVEMTESAAILNNLTRRSLILIDELGRGTSTYDGISIARAIVEYLHEHPNGRAKTLFATHYHELNELESIYPRIHNFNVSVKECDGKVIFMRKLIPGGSEHSFGIHVAQLAGMPRPIVTRAEEILETLETAAAEMRANEGMLPKAIDSEEALSEQPYQLSFFQLDDPVLGQIRSEIIGIDINSLTPLEALNKLNEIKKALTGKGN
ncbi:DNA mismatch repair protein MutS [Porphyromonas sp.]|uniref:DNA mismatch repair protein MutS n=1 Tax=Porphyromonas sp. TaxID=1924944 RepID=UPI0026DB6B1F|nr:DNA mismatch repair protein MutS [Porphyromonas sp.]MDO4770416.1 DNA mismatch repair protein MutS [Porphyromonas sp.]